MNLKKIYQIIFLLEGLIAGAGQLGKEHGGSMKKIQKLFLFLFFLKIKVIKNMAFLIQNKGNLLTCPRKNLFF